LTISKANPRYFSDGKDNVVYITGTHGVSINSIDVVPGGWAEYLAFLKSHNQNFMRLWQPAFSDVSRTTGQLVYYRRPYPYARSNVPGNVDGGNKFDLTRLDQSYFDKLRRRVMSADQGGIYVSIMLFGGSIRRGGPFDAQNNANGVDAIDSNGNATLQYLLPNGNSNVQKINDFEKAYVSKTIDTVHDLGNVLFEIANENGYPDWQYDLVNYIHNYEATQGYPRHPVGVTAMYNYNTDQGQGSLISNQVLVASPAEWISPGGYFPAGSDYPVADGQKVVIGDTDHYWPPYPIPRDRVVWAWECLARGMNPIILNDPTDPENDGTWTDPAHLPGELALGFARMYAQKMNLAAVVPHGELASTRYALAEPGVEYFVYGPPGGGPIAVNLLAGTYAYEWFNPASNRVVRRGTLSVTSGRKSFTPPWGWRTIAPWAWREGRVLYLRNLLPSKKSTE
jgi:hypothetical protein